MHAAPHLVEEARRLVQELFAAHGIDAPDVARGQRPELAEAIACYMRQLETLLDDHLRAALLQPIPEPPPGQRLGRYTIEETIGGGGQGKVYQAHDPDLGRDVAVKILPAMIGAHEYREGRLLAALKHPAIVEIHDVGTYLGATFLVMRLLEGKPLNLVLAEHGPQEARAVARLGVQVADALHTAHLISVLHCDVKPSNIVIDASGKPILIDFGIARMLGVLAPSGAGTPSYMAPEQIAGAELAAATDVFGLGAALYHCLVGRPPFRDHADRRDTPPSPRAARPAVPKDLDAICVKAMQPSPGARYKSAEALRDDLRRFLAGAPVVARPLPAVVRAAKAVRRHPRTAAAAVTLLAGVLWIDVEQRAASARVAAAAVAVAEEQRASSARAWFDAATVAAQRGRWSAALRSCEQALAAGYPDRLAVALARIRAHVGLGNTILAVNELESIGPEPLGPHEAAVLLLRGTLGTNRFLDVHAGVDLVKQALDSGRLTPADAAYAGAFLTDDLREVRQHLERAVELDPSHEHAMAGLGVTFMLLGDFEQARVVMGSLRTAYPESVVVNVLEALVLVAAGDPTAEARIEALEQAGSPGAAPLRVFSVTRDFIVNAEEESVTALDQIQVHPPLNWACPEDKRVRQRAPGIWDHVRDWMVFAKNTAATSLALRKGLTALQDLPRDQQNAIIAYLPLMPAHVLFLKRIVGVLGPILLQSHEAVRGAMDEILDSYPQGYFYLARATALMRLDRFAEADEDLRRAETPSLMPVGRLPSLLSVLMQLCQRDAKWRSPDQVPADLRERGRQTRMQVMELDSLTSQQWARLYRHAIALHDVADARHIADQWCRAFPEDLLPLEARANAEFVAGAYGPAIELADEILRRSPEHAGAQVLRVEALQRIGRVGPPGRALPPGSTPSSRPAPRAVDATFHPVQEGK